MDPQQIFDMYDRLFAEPAWKDMVEDFKQRVLDSSRALLSHSATEAEMHRTQGGANVYNYIITLEDTMDAAKKHVAEEVSE
jgi:hypothetical protein